MEYLKRTRINAIEWPPQSPDLNPIENLWEELFRKVQKTKPSNLDDLWHHLQAAWLEIPVNTIQKLVQSMPRHVKAVLDAHGGHAKY